MRHPSRQEREALLELLLALGGPLVWTGPIPYDALRARHESEHAERPDAEPAATTQQVPEPVAADVPAPVVAAPPVTGSCAA